MNNDEQQIESSMKPLLPSLGLPDSTRAGRMASTRASACQLCAQIKESHKNHFKEKTEKYNGWKTLLKHTVHGLIFCTTLWVKTVLIFMPFQLVRNSACFCIASRSVPPNKWSSFSAFQRQLVAAAFEIDPKMSTSYLLSHNRLHTPHLELNCWATSSA